MKKFFAGLLCMALCLSVFSVGVVADTYGDFEYTVSNGEATITEYTGSATELIIPSTLGGAPVTAIAGFSFYSNNGVGSTVVSLSIPASVTTIEYGALYGCYDVTAYTVSSENPVFEAVDGVLYTKDKKTLVRYPAGRTDDTYTIPDSVTTIDHYAFSDCEKLTSVFVPDGLTTIGDRGFYDCDGLTAITIPYGVTMIGDAAFWGCQSLASVNIPSSVITIGKASFEYCRALTMVTIGEDASAVTDGGTTIGQSAFYSCDNLTTVIIGNGVTAIGIQAFYRCHKLASLSLGTGITTIGKSAFEWCEKLPSLELPQGLTAIERDAFFACEGITTITVPESVTTIGTWALGYVSDGCTTPAPMEGFIIKGVAGSAAEAYALANEIPFEAVTPTDVETPTDVTGTDLGNDVTKIYTGNSYIYKYTAVSALHILKVCVGKEEGSINRKYDVDANGEINAVDALWALQSAVGKRVVEWPLDKAFLE